MSQRLTGTLRTCLAAAAVCFLPLLNANATASAFLPYQVYNVTQPSSGHSSAVAVGDFNGDGRKDVVVAAVLSYDDRPDASFLYVLLQAASGALQTPLKIKYSTEEEEWNSSIGILRRAPVVAADFDQDGIDDIVVGKPFGFSLVLGRNDAAFSVRHVSCALTPCGAEAMATADLDQDGYPDLIAQNQWGAINHGTQAVYGLTVFSSAGAVFAEQRYHPTRSEGGTNLAVHDVNNDGRSDVVISWMQGLTSGAEVFLADGNGRLLTGKRVPRPAALYSVHALAVGNFDGDYKPDIAMGGSSASSTGSGFYFLKNLGDNIFHSGTQLPAAEPGTNYEVPDVAVTVDIGRDGYDDMVVLRSGGYIGYFESGALGFTAEELYPGPYATWAPSRNSVAAGDINNDGCPDVVAANDFAGLVVWRSEKCLSRSRVNGSQPLVRGARPLDLPQEFGSIAVRPPTGAVIADEPSIARSDEGPGEHTRERFSLWLEAILGLALVSFLWWRWR